MWMTGKNRALVDPFVTATDTNRCLCGARESDASPAPRDPDMDLLD